MRGVVVYCRSLGLSQPRLRIRCYDADALSSEFIGECELELPLKQLKTVMDKASDWRWPAKEALTDEELTWFPLRMAKGVEETEEDLDVPLKPTVPAELQPLARLIHDLCRHHRHYLRDNGIVPAAAEGEEHNELLGVTAGVEQRIEQLAGAKKKFEDAEALYTDSSHRHLQQIAEKMLSQAQAENDLTTIRIAKEEIKRHKRSGDQGRDSFTGSGFVDWLQQGQTQLDCSQSRAEAVAVAERLLKLGVVAHVTGKEEDMLNDPRENYLDDEDVLYRFERLREYKARGEVALRIGWAQASTLEKDELRQELADWNVAALKERAYADGVFESKIEATLAAAGSNTERKRDGLIELIVKQASDSEPSTVWEPFAWHGAVRTAKPRGKASLAPVLGFGFTATVLGLVMIFFYSANMSPENTQLWFMTTFWSLLLKIAVLDPLRLVFQIAVLQCVETWPLTRGLVEDKIHKETVKKQKKSARRGKASETKVDTCLRCLSSVCACFRCGR